MIFIDSVKNEKKNYRKVRQRDRYFSRKFRKDVTDKLSFKRFLATQKNRASVYTAQKFKKVTDLRVMFLLLCLCFCLFVFYVVFFFHFLHAYTYKTIPFTGESIMFAQK